LAEDHEVISLIPIDPSQAILFATENGYGKRTVVDEFPTKGRGGKGMIAIQTSSRNGRVVGAISVLENEEIMLISNGGILVRTPVSGISVLGRNTQGVRLINIADDEKLVGVVPVAEYQGGESLGDDSQDSDSVVDDPEDGDPAVDDQDE
jgi:DNA gyrase subunit A